MTTITDDDFIALYDRLGNSYAVSKATGMDHSSINKRKKRIEKRYDVLLDKPKNIIRKSERIECEIEDGIVIVFSDAHFWPGDVTTAYRALLLFIEQFHPQLIVCNGDAFDGSTISRFPAMDWTSAPTVKEEIEYVQDMLGGIEKASKGKLVWTLGNHDARFETNLIATAGMSYEGLRGFSLKDHFPRWLPAMSCWVNKDVCIKHRWKGGIGATRNNAIQSGVTMVTGHLHSLKVTPHTDYNGTRYGVDTGTLAEPFSTQFRYCEDNPRDWRSGFAVLTFHNGKLLPPELVSVWDDNSVCFRGKVVEV